MKKVQILGTGCPSCRRLAELTEQAAQEMELECELEKISDLQRILAMEIPVTPALLVDGEIRSAGRVPTLDEIKALLQ